MLPSQTVIRYRLEKMIWEDGCKDFCSMMTILYGQYLQIFYLLICLVFVRNSDSFIPYFRYEFSGRHKLHLHILSFLLPLVLHVPFTECAYVLFCWR